MDWRRWLDENPLGFIVWRLVTRYGSDFLGVRAGMLAYFVFFSLFPLLLLLISLTGFLLDPEQARQMTFALLREFPGTIRQLVEANVTRAFAARGPVSVIGLVTLAWSTLNVYFALNYALNAIWDTPETRPWYRLYARATGVIGLSLGLVLLTVLAETAWQTFRSLIGPWLPPGAYHGLIQLSTLGLSLTGSWTLFLAIYRFVPRQPVGWRYLWPGACLATVLWKLGESAFAWYLRTLSRTELVYGSVGVIISLMVWLYVSALIALMGAAFNRSLADWHGHQAVRAGNGNDPAASDPSW